MLEPERHSQASLARLEADYADPTQVADVALLIWRDIDTALTPIIGKRGFAALFRRCVQVTGLHHPWLGELREAPDRSEMFTAFHAGLCAQTTSAVVAANGDLLRTFREVLSKLIGGPLTERLLRSVSDSPPRTDLPHE